MGQDFLDTYYHEKFENGKVSFLLCFQQRKKSTLIKFTEEQINLELLGLIGTFIEDDVFF